MCNESSGDFFLYFYITFSSWYTKLAYLRSLHVIFFCYVHVFILYVIIVKQNSCRYTNSWIYTSSTWSFPAFWRVFRSRLSVLFHCYIHYVIREQVCECISQQVQVTIVAVVVVTHIARRLLTRADTDQKPCWSGAQ